MAEEYKKGKVPEIVREFDNTGNKYEINGIDQSKCKFFWRKENEKFQIINSGSYRITQEGGTYYLLIEDDEILTNATQFQICYFFEQQSSAYVDKFPELSVAVRKINDLVEDVKNIFSYLKSTGVTGDTSTMSKVLSELEEQCVWWLNNGRIESLPVSDMYSKFDKLVESLRQELSKLLQEDYNKLSQQLKDETTLLIKSLSDKFDELVTESKEVLDEYTQEKIQEIKEVCDRLLSLEDKLWKANTIEDLKQMRFLKSGDVVEVLGYYTAGDGAGHKRVIASEDDGSGVQLDNGLWANMIKIDEFIYNPIFDVPNVAGIENDRCRIPGITITNKGTLLAVSDLRKGYNDLPNSIKIGMRRSKNQGLNWEKTKVIMNLGDGESNGLSDPCIVHNNQTGRTFVFALNLRTGNILDPNTEWGFYMSYSDDEGESWSDLKNLSYLCPEDFRIIMQAPGNGIFHKNPSGSTFIAIPIQCFQGTDGTKSKSGIMYSNDNGQSWEVSSLVERTTSECCLTVFNEEVFLFCKDEEYKYGRFVYKSSNLGNDWVEVDGGSYGASAQGSCLTIKNNDSQVMLRCENKGYGTTSPRKYLTIKSSSDGVMWKEVVRVRDGASPGYSCMCCDNKYLYVHYEINGIGGGGSAIKRYPISLFKDTSTELSEYDSYLIENPAVINNIMYIQRSTDIVLFKNVENVINKIVCDVVGKIIKIKNIGNKNITINCVTTNEKNTIKILGSIAPATITLEDGDEIELFLSKEKQWFIQNKKQFKKRKAMIDNGVLVFGNKMLQEVYIDETSTITSFRSLNKGVVIKVTTNTEVVLDIPDVYINGMMGRRIYLDKGSVFEIDNTNEYIVINLISFPSAIILNDTNKNLLLINASSNSLRLFDNINRYIFETNIINFTLKYIRLGNCFYNSFNFIPSINNTGVIADYGVEVGITYFKNIKTSQNLTFDKPIIFVVGEKFLYPISLSQ